MHQFLHTEGSVECLAPSTLCVRCCCFCSPTILTPVFKHGFARRTGKAAHHLLVALHAAVCMYIIANRFSPCSHNLFCPTWSEKAYLLRKVELVLSKHSKKSPRCLLRQWLIWGHIDLPGIVWSQDSREHCQLTQLTESLFENRN